MQDDIQTALDGIDNFVKSHPSSPQKKIVHYYTITIEVKSAMEKIRVDLSYGTFFTAGMEEHRSSTSYRQIKE